MVNASELSQIPIRQGNSEACLLSSYGSALYPFTHTPEIKYFVDCCILLEINYLTEGDCIALFRPQFIDQRIGSTKVWKDGNKEFILDIDKNKKVSSIEINVEKIPDYNSDNNNIKLAR